ncbi:MAG: hypothetical protein A3C44_03375 [Gammaproteobacteria bacterium RIFCSPHIGHO2_02_FULL_39_13]|nr:MAG: hypothetical protein A3C44_03375 [Gammaproteobacteria bacterium RIFCSPHIGHO2_02_FULL_39_13]OGT48571.1 MAG: hypothetical protein A3E53_04265 [Gammaproteobacteria bacterium RIFCSPHIGHO2_12_FULL_39_24]
MHDLKNIYAASALNQIPRLLGNMDRNIFSSSYGCCHRDYWLDKTSDFPDAVRQFSMHALALIYRFDMPNSIYYQQEKIKNWAIAALLFWCKIQHKDGSFDEFYPFERGWVGPTAFTTYTAIETYRLLSDGISSENKAIILTAVRKAAYFIIKGDAEEDHLANHHAMACLAVWKAYEILQEEKLLIGYQTLWKNFLKYHHANEGWSIEYDGIDPGYLSATISFLGKIYQTKKDPEILSVVKKYIETCTYFLYPNGFYAGSLGSRNTLHLYTHGFEIFSNGIPEAASIALFGLQALSEGKLVPPDIMSDRYVVYRVPEYLLSYVDRANELSSPLPLLPFQRDSVNLYLEKAGIWARTTHKHYIIANLAKGAVIKIFCRKSNQLIYNDCGIIAKINDNSVITSQWIDADYIRHADSHSFSVSGQMNKVPSNTHFTLFKNLLFRSVLLCIGWHTNWSHKLKGAIRKKMMLGNRRVPVDFTRSLTIQANNVTIEDSIKLGNGVKIKELAVGDEFYVRYVPQSRYFQSQELLISGETLPENAITTLNNIKQWTRKFIIE